ncbi:glutathione S-transferase [Tirmania nivea]|nr:glutathione S-transferase [Tirmania nivea]
MAPSYHGWHFPTPTDNLPGLNTIPDPLYNSKRLSDLYFRANPNFEGRYTVPSSEIIRMLYTEFDDFVDEKHKGVDTQEAYGQAVKQLFVTLDRVEQILTNSPGKYLLGEELTEADIRLYVTIIRFDPVYVQHFKCNIRDIRSGYPSIHTARHLYWDIPAFMNTTEFDHIKKHYTQSYSQINPYVSLSRSVVGIMNWGCT